MDLYIEPAGMEPVGACAPACAPDFARGFAPAPTSAQPSGDVGGARAQSGRDAGCSDACRALQDYLTANYARLRQRLQRRLGCADAASECLHETWLHLARAVITQPVQNPEAYLIRMACNMAIDLLRGSRTRHSVEMENEELDAMPDSAPGPDAIVQARSEIKAVEQAMRCLPPRHQLVLLALRIEGKTREEVARTQGISTRRVDTILRQALDHCAGPAAPTRLLPKGGRAPFGRSVIGTGGPPAATRSFPDGGRAVFGWPGDGAARLPVSP